MSAPSDWETFRCGDVTLQSGVTFPGLSLAYRTYGKLNARKDNAILYPTSFSARHTDIDWLVAPNGVLDPERYFIIIPNLFGNGLSSSPSNSTHCFPPERFPLITYHDAVAVQKRLVTEVLGIDRLALVYGWSMGGMQAYHWAVLFPHMVERAAIICGSARCSAFNHVFLEGVKGALTADAAFENGRFKSRPARGLRAMGRLYAGWAMSYDYFREKAWIREGFTSLEDYLTRSWDVAFAERDANDLLSQIATWQSGDISACPAYGGDLAAAMAAITAKVLLAPGRTDAYFQMRDNEDELPLLVNAASAELVPIPSINGHRAGNPRRSVEDNAFLSRTISAFLKR
jgi:homoserine O-acetyltransferase